MGKLIDLVIEKLEARNQHDAADKLRAVQSSAYTTSSELLGELGLAVRSIQRHHRVDAEINQSLEQIMKAVKKAWPNL